MAETENRDIAIIGAGPIGLEVGISLLEAGLEAVHLDAGQIGETIFRFPPAMRFFSSNERIAIGGIPLHTPDQTKCTREQYLAYLRAVVQHFGLDVRTFERVVHIARVNDHFNIQTRTRAGGHQYCTRSVVLATGGTARPRALEVPGEDLPHVSHALGDGHEYFGRKVVVVGGRNSAVEAALRCWHAGAHVTVCYRREAFPERVKYWLRPEIDAAITDGAIDAHFQTEVVEITPTHVTVENNDTGERTYIPADVVLLMIGYEADMSLFEMLGVTLGDEQHQPLYNPETMETDVPGVYVAGTATAGTQQRFRVYLENCHDHAARIAAALTGQVAEVSGSDYSLPES